MERYNKKIKTVNEYLTSFSGETAKRLKVMRKLVKEVAPKAEECISYFMPAYKLNGILVYFAGYKNHIGLYPFPSAIKAFKKDLAEYKTSKGGAQFPIDKPMPEALIKKIIKFRIGENLAKNRKSGATIKG